MAADHLGTWVNGWSVSQPNYTTIANAVQVYLAPGTVFDDGVTDTVVGGNNQRDLFYVDLDGQHGDDDLVSGMTGDLAIWVG